MQTLIRATRAYQLLKAEGEKSRFSHAYLVHFDDARNLRACLKLFAKLFFLSLENAQSSQYQRIENLIDEEHFADCLFYPKGDKFLVEDAEKITEECLLQPVEQDKKVFVISDFAQANVAAQNKLLKLLEEPPKNVVFLLGTTSVFPVLPTVLSRVKKLEIPPFDPEKISSALQRTYAQRYSLVDFELCAAACGGCVGTAQNMLEGGFYRSLLTDAFSLCLAKNQDLPKIIKNIGEIKQKKEFLSLLRIIFRDALLLKTKQNETRIFLRSERENLLKIAQSYSISALLFAQTELSNTEQQLFFNTVFPQAMEILFIKIFQNKEKIW